MELDKSELDVRLFDGFAATSKRRYIYVCNMNTGVSRWSTNAIEYFDLPGEYMENAGELWGKLLHPDDQAAYFADIEAVFSGKKKRHDLDYKVRNRDGEYVACSCRGVVVKGHAGHATLFVGAIENHGIMDNIDGITGLYNIYEFHNYLHKVSQEDKKLSVMFIGVGRFSEINDAYGFSFGDRVLKETAVALFHLVRPTGMIFKMDGMRFACVFENTPKETIESIYIEIRQILKNDITVDGISISLMVAGGAVLDCRDYDEYSIHTSGKYALSQSKREENGDLVFFDNTLLGDNIRNLSLIRELRRDVLSGCDNFFMNYQPIINAKTEQILGAEALLRFNSSDLGVVPPGVFIPWLEKDPCFYELGNWILKKAILDMKFILAKHPDFMLNVNVAYPQLANSDFKFEVLRILKETGYPAANLTLELTERCRQLDKNYLKNEIIFLKSKGIKIALDDFGTGFSSIGLLTEFPVDTIKIDRGFVNDITSNKINQTIVNAITICANDLNIRVCVEGLEERDMIDFIKKYHVHSLQGYYFSRPISLEVFRERFDK